MAGELIAVDTSVLIPWLNGVDIPDPSSLTPLLQSKRIVLPPVTLAETFAGPPMTHELAEVLRTLPLLQIRDGYWERAGLLRSRALKSGRRARLGDALIAQACIDCDVPLLTRDADFQVFAEVGGLKFYSS